MLHKFYSSNCITIELAGTKASLSSLILSKFLAYSKITLYFSSCHCTFFFLLNIYILVKQLTHTHRRNGFDNDLIYTVHWSITKCDYLQLLTYLYALHECIKHGCIKLLYFLYFILLMGNVYVHGPYHKRYTCRCIFVT